MVNGQQDAIAAALIDAIHMHKTFSYELRLHPFALYLPQDPISLLAEDVFCHLLACRVGFEEVFFPVGFAILALVLF